MPQPRSLEEWKRLRAQMRSIPPPAATRERRAIRRRPRSDDEWEALFAVAAARRRRYLASGKLERLGERRWRYHLGNEKLIEYERRRRRQ